MPFKFRFRKSFKVAPGVKVNVSEKGVRSATVGGKRARVNISGKGTTVGGNLGAGVSYQQKLGGSQPAEQGAALTPAPSSPRRRSRLVPILAWTAVIIFGIYILSALLG